MGQRAGTGKTTGTAAAAVRAAAAATDAIISAMADRLATGMPCTLVTWTRTHTHTHTHTFPQYLRARMHPEQAQVMTGRKHLGRACAQTRRHDQVNGAQIRT